MPATVFAYINHGLMAEVDPLLRFAHQSRQDVGRQRVEVQQLCFRCAIHAGVADGVIKNSKALAFSANALLSFMTDRPTEITPFAPGSCGLLTCRVTE